MAGKNYGTGQPFWFRCSNCRRNHPAHRDEPRFEGRLDRVRLTGKVRTVPQASGRRVCDVVVQYECRDCGHIGWSRHVDIVRAHPQRYQVDGDKSHAERVTAAERGKR
jgi:hypothetical protein